MNAAAGIANLRAGAGRWAVFKTGGAHRPAHRLSDGFVGFTFEVWAGAESFDGGVDDARIDFPDSLPGETLAVEHSRTEIFDHHVRTAEQFNQDLLALFGLEIERDAALVTVQHGEIQAIDAGQIAQLRARDIAASGQFDLDNVRPQPRQNLGAARACLNMAQVQYSNARQCLVHRVLSPGKGP